MSETEPRTAAERDALTVLSKVCGVAESELRPERHLVSDLNVDSVQTLDLLMTLEERLEVEITEVDAARLQTVGDILRFVRDKS